jgi:hypothetical protein
MNLLSEGWMAHMVHWGWQSQTQKSISSDNLREHSVDLGCCKYCTPTAGYCMSSLTKIIARKMWCGLANWKLNERKLPDFSLICKQATVHCWRIFYATKPSVLQTYHRYIFHSPKYLRVTRKILPFKSKEHLTLDLVCFGCINFPSPPSLAPYLYIK